MKMSAATQLRSGTRRGTRRAAALAPLAAAAGCVATAHRQEPINKAGPAGTIQDQPEPLNSRYKPFRNVPLRSRPGASK
jgi:hypothetical protein